MHCLWCWAEALAATLQPLWPRTLVWKYAGRKGYATRWHLFAAWVAPSKALLHVGRVVAEAREMQEWV